MLLKLLMLQGQLVPSDFCKRIMAHYYVVIKSTVFMSVDLKTLSDPRVYRDAIALSRWYKMNITFLHD